MESPDVTLDFQLLPDHTVASQKRVIDDLLSRHIDGIAISPVDSDGQTKMLQEVGRQALLFTQDNDAPASGRVCYVGADNVAAGRVAGSLVKEVLPGGGKIIVFASAPETGNTHPRLDGLRQALVNSQVEVLELRPDDGDSDRAYANVLAALSERTDVACLVGLRSYHGPVMARALREAARASGVKAVCFDDADETLQGIRDGVIHASVAQQTYEYGRQTILLMSRYLSGHKEAVPAGGKVIIPTFTVRQDNVEDYVRERKARADH